MAKLIIILRSDPDVEEGKEKERKEKGKEHIHARPLWA